MLGLDILLTKIRIACDIFLVLVISSSRLILSCFGFRANHAFPRADQKRTVVNVIFPEDS